VLLVRLGAKRPPNPVAAHQGSVHLVRVQHGSIPLPSDVSSALGFLTEIVYKATRSFDICLGDYSGSEISKSSTLTYSKCDSIPLMSEFRYGLLAGYVNNVPCGATPQNINFCATFDRCGTVALSINAGIAQCAATYSTGIAAFLSPFSGTLDYLSFGISPKRRFTQTFNVAVISDYRIETREVTTYGHFFIGVGLGLPIKLNFGGKSLEEILSVDLSVTYLADFGNASSTITNLIKSIGTVTKDKGRGFLNSILNSAAELTLTINGVATLNFNDMTRGFLPNLEMNLAKCNVLISS
jgi:hypothetical protein